MLKVFLLASSGCHFVQQGRTVCAILLKDHFCEILNLGHLSSEQTICAIMALW